MSSLVIHENTLPYPLEATIPASPIPKPREWSPRSVNGEGRRMEITRKQIRTTYDPYAFLKHFDTIFLIDDSASMERYWDQVGALLERIAPICTARDPNGVDIFFVNHRPRGYHMFAALGAAGDRAGYRHIGQSTGTEGMRDNVAGIFGSIKKLGSRCRLDRQMAHILDGYVREYERSCRRTEGPFLRPVNLIVITAGVTDDNPNDTLIRTARRLDELDAPPYQVGVQFFRMGDDESARQAMEFADNTLGEALDIRDIVDTVTWSGKQGELSPDAVLKVVLGAVQKSFDEKAV